MGHPNKLYVHEEIARTRILAAIRTLISDPTRIRHARKVAAQKLMETSRGAADEIRERRGRLARTEDRIKRLVILLADGDTSEYIRSTVRDLEGHAATEKAAIADLEAIASEPIWLPSPEQILEHYIELEKLLTKDVDRGREALRQLLRDGKIALHPGEDRIYTAVATLLPLKALRLAAKPGVSGPYTVVVAGAGFEPTTFGL